MIEESLSEMNLKVINNNHLHNQKYKQLREMNHKYYLFCERARKDHNTWEGMKHTLEEIKKNEAEEDEYMMSLQF